MSRSEPSKPPKSPHRPIDEVVLPKNLNAERIVLGATILQPNRLSVVREKLRPEELYLQAHQILVARMLQMADAGLHIDLPLLADELRRNNELETAGGAGYVASLIDGIQAVLNLESYLRIIKDDAARRQAILQAQAIIEGASARDDVAEIKQRFAVAASAIEAADERPRTVSAAELSTLDLKPREALLENLLNTRSTAEIFAWRGVGKTWFATGLADAVASGAVLGRWRAPCARRVLYVDGELPAAELQQRIRALGATHENLKLLSCDMQPDPFPHLATARAQRMIESALGDNTELMILDNLATLAPSGNETEAEDWILIQTWLLNLRRQGLTSIFLHHAGYAGHARGTTRREDLLDLVIELRRPKDYVASEGLRFELHFTKTRGMLGAAAEPAEARLIDGADGTLVWTWADLQDLRVAKIVELKENGNSWREIESITGVPHSTAERLYRKHNGKANAK